MQAIAADDETLVQLTVIDKLKAIQEKAADPVFVRSVLELYFEHTPPLIDRLAEAFSTRDVQQAKRLAHRLKGSSASVGANRMASLCRAVEETDLANATAETLAAEINGMRDVYARTRQQLTALI